MFLIRISGLTHRATELFAVEDNENQLELLSLSEGKSSSEHANGNQTTPVKLSENYNKIGIEEIYTLLVYFVIKIYRLAVE